MSFVIRKAGLRRFVTKTSNLKFRFLLHFFLRRFLRLVFGPFPLVGGVFDFLLCLLETFGPFPLVGGDFMPPPVSAIVSPFPLATFFRNRLPRTSLKGPLSLHLDS